MGSDGTSLPPPSPAPQPPAPGVTRPLRRSVDDRVVGGVCGGVGRYVGVDPVIIRIAFVVVALAGGSGLIAYVIAWIVIPEEHPGDDAGLPGDPHIAAGAGAGAGVLGLLLVALGAALLLDRVVPGFRSVLGPLVLIGIGVFVLVKVR